MTMDAKQAALIAKNYFQETKTHIYFLFDTISAENRQGFWIIECEIEDTFGGEKTDYILTISDEDGAIVDVKKFN